MERAKERNEAEKELGIWGVGEMEVKVEEEGIEEIELDF
jgi:hypothetical protein